jgi:hypothetical protein
MAVNDDEEDVESGVTAPTTAYRPKCHNCARDRVSQHVTLLSILGRFILRLKTWPLRDNESGPPRRDLLNNHLDVVDAVAVGALFCLLLLSTLIWVSALVDL